MSRRAVEFYSEGSKIAGDLYLPEGEEDRFPCVVLCHGFAGIKEVALPAYAVRFAREGFAALAFDYRGFGASEGARGRLVPAEQVVDIRNAITFAGSLPEVDPARVGLWGTSFGGANAIAAAALDGRAKAVVAQLAFGDGGRVVLGDMAEEQKTKLMSTLAKARTRAVVKNKILTMSPEQILTDPDSVAFYKKAVEAHPAIKISLPMLILEAIIEYRPEEVVSRISPRALMVISAEVDASCPPEESRRLFEMAGEPKEFVMLEGARHYDTYAGEHLKASSAAAVRWFGEHL
ncbi:MAG: alpha/beta hydrolase [Planctomycetota bacterium]|jgi:fermentation-respiration switch protein FrsA (DUF1100 family)